MQKVKGVDLTVIKVDFNFNRVKSFFGHDTYSQQREEVFHLKAKEAGYILLAVHQKVISEASIDLLDEKSEGVDCELIKVMHIKGFMNIICFNGELFVIAKTICFFDLYVQIIVWVVNFMSEVVLVCQICD